MLKRVNVEISYKGEVIYNSYGKTLLGVMLQTAAMLVTYKSLSIYITIR